MPTGAIKTLRKVQIVNEAAKGTAIAATHVLLADATLKPDYALYRNPHPIGVLSEFSGPTALLKKDVDIDLEMDGASFQQIAWLLSLGIDQPASVDLNEGASAGPYSHAWDPGLAALWNPHSATLEGRWTDGTDHEDIEVEYATARSLSLSIEQKGQLKASANLFGRQMTDATITALTAPTVIDPITAAMGSYYINDTWAAAAPATLEDAPAAGQVSNQIISATLDLDCGQEPFHGIQGNAYFAEAKETAKNFKLAIRCLYNGALGSEGAAAERVHAAAGDMRFVTLRFAGITCRSSDATSTFSLRIALAGKHEFGDFANIGEQDGMDVVDMSIVGHYDPTGAKLIEAVVINDTATALG